MAKVAVLAHKSILWFSAEVYWTISGEA